MFVGIDPGMRSMAIVALSDKGMKSRTISAPVDTVADGIVSDVVRIKELAIPFWRAIAGLELSGQANFAIEGPAFARAANRTVQTGMLHYMIYDAIIDQAHPGVRIVTVPPKTLKKFTTGNGNATKEEMKSAILARWGVRFPSHDLYDAYALARVAQDCAMDGDDILAAKVVVHACTGDAVEVIHAPSKASRRRRRRKRSNT